MGFTPVELELGGLINNKIGKSFIPETQLGVILHGRYGTSTASKNGRFLIEMVVLANSVGWIHHLERIDGATPIPPSLSWLLTFCHLFGSGDRHQSKQKSVYPARNFTGDTFSNAHHLFGTYDIVSIFNFSGVL